MTGSSPRGASRTSRTRTGPGARAGGIELPPSVTGIEVFNAGCELEVGRGLSSVHWDELLQDGRICPALVTDDSHHPGFDSDHAWTWIRAERSRESVLDALRTGRFYGSTGPRDPRRRDDRRRGRRAVHARAVGHAAHGQDERHRGERRPARLPVRRGHPRGDRRRLDRRRAARPARRRRRSRGSRSSTRRGAGRGRTRCGRASGDRAAGRSARGARDDGRSTCS